MHKRSSTDELETIWQGVREELRRSTAPSTFDLWLAPLRPVSTHDRTLFLTGPAQVRRWVKRRYGPRVLDAVRSQSDRFSHVDFVAPPTDESSAAAADAPLNPGYTFDRFVIGPGNRFAHAAALAVAELPGDAYNPLFLHGPPGLGKTHLLVAIAGYLHRNHPEQTVMYTTAEQFTTEFVAALRGAGGPTFKERHRDLGVLLIDDIQFLVDKPRTEEEFFHTFNALYESGSQIVLSSDRPPQALSQLAERLRDRFEWGLCADLQPPDLHTRLVLLRRLVAERPLPLSDPSVLREIATRVPANLRRLEGALTRVSALVSMLGEKPSPELVRRALGPLSTDSSSVAEADQPHPTVEQIQEAVCSAMRLSASEMRSTSRKPHVVRARQLAMYLAREITPLSLNEIATRFDRDHTTVLHAVRTTSKRLEPGSDLHRSVKRVHKLLYTSEHNDDSDSPIHRHP